MLKVCFAWIWLPQILLAAVFCQLCGAQTDPAIQLANQVRADVGSLAAGRTWSTWQTGHPHEALKEFDYETSATPPAYDTTLERQQGKCGFSVGQLPGGVTRAASFYAPLVQAGKLRPLPEQVNRTLIQRCGLDELWYVAHSLVRMESVVVALESAWGKANERGVRGNGFRECAALARHYGLAPRWLERVDRAKSCLWKPWLAGISGNFRQTKRHA